MPPMQSAAAAEARRLLRILFVRISAVPVDSRKEVLLVMKSAGVPGLAIAALVKYLFKK